MLSIPLNWLSDSRVPKYERPLFFLFSVFRSDHIIFFTSQVIGGLHGEALLWTARSATSLRRLLRLR